MGIGTGKGGALVVDKRKKKTILKGGLRGGT